MNQPTKSLPLKIPESEYDFTLKFPQGNQYPSPWPSSLGIDDDATRLIPGAQNKLFSEEVVITAEFMDEMLEDMEEAQINAHSTETMFFRKYFISPFNHGKFKKILNKHGTLTENTTALSAYAIAEKIFKKNKNTPKDLSLYQFKTAIFEYFQHSTLPIVPQL